MTTTASSETDLLNEARERTYEFPLGILGFEMTKKYLLLPSEEDAPFQWLQMLEAPNQAFLVVPPASVTSDYEPKLADEDVRYLGLARPEDAWVFNIVTLRSNGQSTVNLKGPIVFNRRTRIGKQVIPLNAAHYPLQHPLPTVA